MNIKLHYTTVDCSRLVRYLNVFEEVSYAHHIEKYFQFFILIYFKTKFIYMMEKLHDPFEIILICRFCAQETFLIIIDAQNGCAA